jgi:hypothetical protein
VNFASRNFTFSNFFVQKIYIFRCNNPLFYTFSRFFPNFPNFSDDLHPSGDFFEAWENFAIFSHGLVNHWVLRKNDYIYISYFLLISSKVDFPDFREFRSFFRSQNFCYYFFHFTKISKIISKILKTRLAVK